MTPRWDSERILEAGRGFQIPCVLVAAAELDLFSALSRETLDDGELARRLETNPRATRMLADALTALGLLEKGPGGYRVIPGLGELLDEGSEESVVAMLRHQANCLRSWAQLAAVVRDGGRYERPPSVRGPEEDLRSFIEAMEVASREAAPRVVAALGELPYTHLLDLGGGPGTWTRAFLRAHPALRATLYDLPSVLPIARAHFEAEGLLERVELVDGDFNAEDALPAGADLAWLSAIIHQNSREENRALYCKVYQALAPGGRILIRDMVMREDHTAPVAGAMFAINMLVNTTDGGTYSGEEQRADLEDAGFTDVRIRDAARDMDWIVQADKR